MSKAPFALSTIPPASPTQGDYDAICAAVMHSARGRWFLTEFARRNRNTDTKLVLEAIDRLEAVFRGDRSRGLSQSLRIDLLKMAKAIAETRAEVAEIRLEPAALATSAQAARTDSRGPSLDVFAAAERIQDVAWTMRERGLDPATCEQIEELATSLLSASALRNPNDDRAQKLGEVLQYLEGRVNAMLKDVTTVQDSAQAPSGTGTEAEEDQALQAESEDHAPPAGNGDDGVHTAAGLGAAVGVLSVGIGHAGVDASALAHSANDEATTHGARKSGTEPLQAATTAHPPSGQSGLHDPPEPFAGETHEELLPAHILSDGDVAPPDQIVGLIETAQTGPAPTDADFEPGGESAPATVTQAHMDTTEFAFEPNSGGAN